MLDSTNRLKGGGLDQMDVERVENSRFDWVNVEWETNLVEGI